jgi:hypothetical protein
MPLITQIAHRHFTDFSVINTNEPDRKVSQIGEMSMGGSDPAVAMTTVAALTNEPAATLS